MLIFTTNITHCYTLALPHIITFTWHFNCHLFNSVLPNNPCCSVLIQSPTHMLSISSYLICERQRNFNVRCVGCFFFYQHGFYILLCEICIFVVLKVFTINRGHLQSASEMVKEACTRSNWGLSAVKFFCFCFCFFATFDIISVISS